MTPRSRGQQHLDVALVVVFAALCWAIVAGALL